jgi:uncharacterized membrane protein YjfL (UPF0719 family)
MHLPDYFLGDIAATVGFGLVAIFLMILGYKLFDKATPNLPFDEEIRKGNVAMAIVVGSFILGLCYVIGRVVASVMG